MMSEVFHPHELQQYSFFFFFFLNCSCFKWLIWTTEFYKRCNNMTKSVQHDSTWSNTNTQISSNLYIFAVFPLLLVPQKEKMFVYEKTIPFFCKFLFKRVTQLDYLYTHNDPPSNWIDGVIIMMLIGLTHWASVWIWLCAVMWRQSSGLTL